MCDLGDLAGGQVEPHQWHACRAGRSPHDLVDGDVHEPGRGLCGGPDDRAARVGVEDDELIPLEPGRVVTVGVPGPDPRPTVRFRVTDHSWLAAPGLEPDVVGRLSPVERAGADQRQPALTQGTCQRDCRPGDVVAAVEPGVVVPDRHVVVVEVDADGGAGRRLGWSVRAVAGEGREGRRAHDHRGHHGRDGTRSAPPAPADRPRGTRRPGAGGDLGAGRREELVQGLRHGWPLRPTRWRSRAARRGPRGPARAVP